MENIALVVHILAALAIIGLILLQQGKGAVAGASFGGGASQTVFGSQGGSSFFTRATAVCAVIFFATSFGLAIIAKNKVAITDSAIPTAIESQQEQNAPAEESEVPEVEASTQDAGSDVPEVPAEPESQN